MFQGLGADTCSKAYISIFRHMTCIESGKGMAEVAPQVLKAGKERLAPTREARKDFFFNSGQAPAPQLYFPMRREGCKPRRPFPAP